MEINAQIISEDTYQAFIQQNEYSVILVDTEWDVRGRARILPTFRKAIKEHEDIVAFGQFDPDVEEALASRIIIPNVPTVLYFRKGELVASLLSSLQNVSARISALINSEELGYHDGNDCY